MTALELIAKEKIERTRRLDLGKCGLKSIPDELFELSWLEMLNLSNRYVDWQKWQWVESNNNGADNSISKLKKGIIKLNNLKILMIGGDIDISWKINDIQLLENLTALQTLYLGNNQIRDISFLANLINLKKLYINNNQISDISYLSNLTALLTLDLSNNKISDIRCLKKLNSIDTLNLSNNKITDISPLKSLIIDIGLEKQRDWFGSGILIEDNPLVIPPQEIVERGKEAVIRYFKELEEKGKDYLYEAKILIVGEGRVGKTTLLRKLQDNKAVLPSEEEDTTRGIDIEVNDSVFKTRNKKNITIHFWDFGGQAIYHATHQFFLTKRSLYILVDDSSRDDVDLDYWFHVIEKLAGNSPVILVQNIKANRPKGIDERGFREHYLNLITPVYFIDFSFKQNDSDAKMQLLRNEIQYQIEKLPHVGQELPRNWVQIRQELKELESKEPFISLDEYIGICDKYEINEYEKAIGLSAFFHDLGIFLHFQDDPVLRQTIILQKEWATKAVYRLLDDNNIKLQSGRFCLNDAKYTWHEISYRKKLFELLELMKKFELIYSLPLHDNGEYMAPQLLPESQPEGYKWNFENNLRLIYSYDFMPKGLLSRFIVRMHRFLNDTKINELAWKRGVQLFRENTRAEIREVYGSKKIEIRIEGLYRKEFMTIITEDFDQLNKSYNDIPVEKLIPCNCNQCKKRENDLALIEFKKVPEDMPQPHFYTYSNLQNRQEKGKRTVECDVSFETIEINSLLEGVFAKRSEIREPLKLFISYSTNDKAYLHKLVTFLNPLKRSGNLVTWDDTNLIPGEEWNDRIRYELSRAEVIIFLISPDSIESKYINDIEMKHAFERFERREAVLIPVIIRPCLWKNTRIARLDVLPEGGKAVNTWKNQDLAFTEVAQGIDKVIKKILDKDDIKYLGLSGS
jgi:internalin A